MKGLVSVSAGLVNPVAQAVGVCVVQFCKRNVYVETFVVLVFALAWGEYYSHCKNVENILECEEGGFLGSIKMTEDFAKEGNVFLPCQFSNEDNTEAHEKTTAVEIANQLASLGLKADGFVAGVGTGGTVMGISRGLEKVNPDCRAFPLEPSNSPTLSTGYKVGKHRIYGISDEFIPPILKLPEMDSIVSVDDGDAIAMARLLSESLGIGVGVSSGANFLGALLAQEKLDSDAVIATVFADDNKKYLSTDYAKPLVLTDGMLTKEIQLTGLRVIR